MKKKSKISSFFTVLVLLIVAGAVPVTVYLVQQRQELRKEAAIGRDWVVCFDGGADCDFDYEGGDNPAAIQSAIDVSIDGDRVVIKEGEYFIDEGMEAFGVSENEFISIKGDGIDKTILNGTVNDLPADASGLIFRNTHFQLSSLTIKHFGNDGIFAEDVPTIEITNIKVVYNGLTGDSGIHVKGSDGGSIRNSWIEENGYGITIEGSDDVYFNNNVVYRNRACGVSMYLYSPDGDIINNTITDNGWATGPSCRDGIIISDSFTGELYNNTINGNSGYGINTDAVSGDFSFIKYNNVYDNGYGDYADVIGDLNGTDGNISVPTNFEDEEFHLADTSDLVDAGNPVANYNDPNDGSGNAEYPSKGTEVNDIGAYGGPGASGWIDEPPPQNNVPTVSCSSGMDVVEPGGTVTFDCEYSDQDGIDDIQNMSFAFSVPETNGIACDGNSTPTCPNFERYLSNTFGVEQVANPSWDVLIAAFSDGENDCHGTDSMPCPWREEGENEPGTVSLGTTNRESVNNNTYSVQYNALLEGSQGQLASGTYIAWALVKDWEETVGWIRQPDCDFTVTDNADLSCGDICEDEGLTCSDETICLNIEELGENRCSNLCADGSRSYQDSCNCSEINVGCSENCSEEDGLCNDGTVCVDADGELTCCNICDEAGGVYSCEDGCLCEVEEMTLTLDIKLERRNNHARDKVEIWLVKGSDMNKYETMSNNDGETEVINLEVLDTGNYTMYVKPEQYISKKAEVTLSDDENYLVINTSFRVGDYNQTESSYDFINALDFSMFIKYLREQNFTKGDINEDGAVNAVDYSVTLKTYREERIGAIQEDY